MAMMAGTVRPTICFVAREESVHAAVVIASDRHQGAPQSTNEYGSVTTGDPPGWDEEANDVVVDHGRHHESQTNEAPVSQREWAGNVLGECQLDVPHGTSRKPCASGERLGSLAAAMQRFALNADAGRLRAHAGVAERLPHRGYRLLLVALPLSRSRPVRWLDRAGEGDCGDAAEQAGWLHVATCHRCVVGDD